MAATYLNNAKQSGVDCLVTPCLLCHISLDTYQGKSAKQIRAEINLPVMHLSQLVGLALDVDAKKPGFSKHMVSMGQVLSTFKTVSSRKILRKSRALLAEVVAKYYGVEDNGRSGF